MIGSDANLTPQKIQIQRSPVRSGLGLSPPRYISDATTEAAANNAIAQGYQTGRVQAKAGFSNSAGTRYQQGIQDAQALRQGAQQAAEMRSEDQATNAQLRDQYRSMQDTERARRNSFDMSMHNALLSHRQDVSRDAMTQGLDFEKRRQKERYSLLGRLV